MLFWTGRENVYVAYNSLKQCLQKLIQESKLDMLQIVPVCNCLFFKKQSGLLV